MFGSVVDMLVDLYDHSQQFGRMVKLVDDFSDISPPHQSWNETDFMNYTGRFGVPQSTKKLRPLNAIQRCIGSDWDLDNKLASLPKEKEKATLDLVES